MKCRTSGCPHDALPDRPVCGACHTKQKRNASGTKTKNAERVPAPCRTPGCKQDKLPDRPVCQNCHAKKKRELEEKRKNEQDGLRNCVRGETLTRSTTQRSMTLKAMKLVRMSARSRTATTKTMPVFHTLKASKSDHVCEAGLRKSSAGSTRRKKKTTKTVRT